MKYLLLLLLAFISGNLCAQEFNVDVSIVNADGNYGAGKKLIFRHSQAGSEVPIGTMRSFLVDGSAYRAGKLIFSTSSGGSMYDRLTISENGGIGIGTSFPFNELNNRGLHIDNGIHSSVLLGNPKYSGYGGVLQTSDSRHRIFIGANIYDDDVAGWSHFEAGKGGAGISILADEGSWGTAISFYTSSLSNVIETRMSITGNGDVGIGTTTPSNRLEVNGTIRSKEVKVEITGWPDYVFSEDYKLPSLQETATYIKANGHLPGMPTADRVNREGIALGEMNAKLLEKIEELTLYQIELLEKLENEKARNDEQQKEIAVLKNKLR